MTEQRRAEGFVPMYAEVTQVPKCPPASAAPMSMREAYRFIKNSPPLEEDFLPIAKQKYNGPPRRPDCSHWAISLFASEAHARAKFEMLVRNTPAIRERWRFLAKGPIKPSDGIATPVTLSGHMDLHPARGAVLHTAFAVVGGL